MSTSTPNLIAPPPPGSPPAETAPSQAYDEGQAFGRMVGFAGLFGLVLGGVVIVTNQALAPRWIGSGWGFLIAAAGVVLMLYHATKDGEQEVRRLYGMLAAAFLVLGVIFCGITKRMIFRSVTGTDVGFGANVLPWGVTFGGLALVFAIPFIRHETDRRYRDGAVNALLGIGALLAIGSIMVGLAKPETLLGPGVAMALLGLAYLCAYMTQVDTSEGIGYQVAFLLGTVGAAVAAWAFARSAFPPVLVEGPNAIRKVTGEIDFWKLVPRLVSIAIFLGVAFLAFRAKALQGWVRAAIIAAGLGAAALFALASVKANLIATSPAPYLVPTGVILMGLGLLYLGVALAICSDNQFVTLTRRELAAFFLSPVGFLVIAGMAAIEWLGYVFFIAEVQAVSRQRPMDEPIVSQYFVALIPVIGLLLEVPAITMRLVAEEKKSGSLEVLMTAPVNEWPVIASKFLATWMFFMLTWVPCGLYLIALRVEGGESFDYRPMLSFYIALGAQGLAFVGLGLLFSTLTRNQIIAAVLTFAVMILFLATYLVRFQVIPFVPPLAQTLLGKLSFIHMWQESLGGRLPLRDVLVFASIGVFSLFLSVKVLEARKWN